MKTKNLATIFILLLLITLASALTVFLTKEKNQLIASERPVAVETPAESIISESANALREASEKNATPQSPLVRGNKNIEAPQTVEAPAEEKIKAVMIIDGHKYETAIKPGSSVYDLMLLLRQERKINFQGKNYSGLGFFAQEINGLKNNPAGKNWVYYVNGRPAPVGVSSYELKNNDAIEWKYEAKNF